MSVAEFHFISPVQAADVDFGVRGGVYPDEEEPFLFLDNGGLTTYSFDFHYDFTKAASYTLWAGGGPTLIHRDFDASAPADNIDSTDPGVNLLFGVGGTEGKVRPYGQFKVIVADDPARLQPLEYGSDSQCLNERVPPAATGGTLHQNEAFPLTPSQDEATRQNPGKSLLRIGCAIRGCGRQGDSPGGSCERPGGAN
jgi:hypothetical protein